MRWISLISSGHCIQMQNTPSSQVRMEYSPEYLGHILGHKIKKKKTPKVGNKREMMGDIKESQEIQHPNIRLVQK